MEFDKNYCIVIIIVLVVLYLMCMSKSEGLSLIPTYKVASNVSRASVNQQKALAKQQQASFSRIAASKAASTPYTKPGTGGVYRYVDGKAGTPEAKKSSLTAGQIRAIGIAASLKGKQSAKNALNLAIAQRAASVRGGPTISSKPVSVSFSNSMNGSSTASSTLDDGSTVTSTISPDGSITSTLYNADGSVSGTIS